MILCCIFGVCVLEADVKGEGLSRAVNTYSRFGIFSKMFLKEVGLLLQAYCLHPFEWVPSFVVTLASKGNE
jgi:hypothetical protein